MSTKYVHAVLLINEKQFSWRNNRVWSWADGDRLRFDWTAAYNW